MNNINNIYYVLESSLWDSVTDKGVKTAGNEASKEHLPGSSHSVVVFTVCFSVVPYLLEN